MSSVSPVHRDRHSRPAPPAPVHAPAHLPCCVASPITHTPVRSESARLSAPRGGCCRFVMRSAGSSRQQVCDDRLGCVGILTATGLCSWRCSFVSGAHGMPNAAWRQCDVRATATASDGMLLSGVPILGCRSPPGRHSGPLLQFKKSASGCCLARACPARRGNLTQLEPGLCLSGPTWDSGMVGITVTRTHSGRASESWPARRPPPTVSPSGLRGQGRSRRRPRPGARNVIRHDRGL